LKQMKIKKKKITILPFLKMKFTYLINSLKTMIIGKTPIIAKLIYFLVKNPNALLIIYKSINDNGNKVEKNEGAVSNNSSVKKNSNKKILV